MKTRVLIIIGIICIITGSIFFINNVEARSFSDFRWNIDEKYHRDGHVQFVVEKGSKNFLPVGIRGLSDVTVDLHPTINFDQTGPAKLPRGIDIYFEPNRVTVADDEVKTVKLMIIVDENVPANLYDVQLVGTWKEEGRVPDFMGTSIRLHVGRDFGDGKIPVNMFEPPLKFWKSVKNEEGVALHDTPCRNDYVLLVKASTQTPACVKPVTKQHLIDRGWAKTVELNEIQNSPDSLKLNIVRIEDGRVSLHPENTCASINLDLLLETDIQRYRNDKKGLDDTNVLQITSDDLKEIPNIQELIYAVHSIESPYNKHSSVYLDGITFVEYEFFLMDKAIDKYGDSQGDYFIKLDEDYAERFTNPTKEGFSNTFESPIILYNEKAYSVGGTVFWTSDEHKPMRLGVYPKDVIDEDEKFIILTDDDMKSVPKIKEAIEGIGTIKESVTGSKGLPEWEQNQYMEWFEQKSQDQLGTDRFRLIEYNDHLYSIGFSIC